VLFHIITDFSYHKRIWGWAETSFGLCSSSAKNHQSIMVFSSRAQTFTTSFYLDVDSPFQPVHINSTSSLGQTTASHFASTIFLVLVNIGPLVLASSLIWSRTPSFVKSRASESVETRARRSCVYRQCILVINLPPGKALVVQNCQKNHKIA
jgi:hypothetical protein